MINISGYRQGADLDSVDFEHNITVNCCGHYRLIKTPFYETRRPYGRRDYQILYVAGGKGHFELSKGETEVEEGEAVLFLPGQPQKYQYYLSEQPDIYWLHFSGKHAEKIPRMLGCPEGGLCRVGVHGEYISVLDRIIRELQMKRPGFEELSSLYAREMFLLMSRHMAERENRLAAEGRIQEAIEMMNRDFASERSISEYAAIFGVSTCWFIRSFREYMGISPQKYIIRVRMEKAKEFLLFSSYQIGEISSLIGYDNPLYFSRIFHSVTGVSPRQYRENFREKNGQSN